MVDYWYIRSSGKSYVVIHTWLFSREEKVILREDALS